jgi:hypothetical protein
MRPFALRLATATTRIIAAILTTRLTVRGPGARVGEVGAGVGAIRDRGFDAYSPR